MRCKIQSITVALFISSLVLPGKILAHDGEHKSQGEHSSPKHYDEGSGMKMHSEKYDDHKNVDKHDNHGEPYTHLGEGSGMR